MHPGFTTWLMALVAAFVTEQASGGSPEVAAAGTAQRNTVSPSTADLPPVGRSLFDFVMTHTEGGRKVQRVPFPFSTLLAHIEAQLEGGTPKGIKLALIPLGRSLQRNAAPDELFTYPRVVAAVVGEPRERPGSASILLKDRLYIGYHEKAAVLEVISYNEAAGRFEFQVVRDYRQGGRPKVLYANRSLCLACHQNGAPIFSRPTWDETDANPLVADRLREARRDFYGIAPSRNVDVPNAIDDATDRANLFSVAQLLWREGCEYADEPDRSVRCRAQGFLAALKYRLSGGRYVELHKPDKREDLAELLVQSWKARWPEGLPIPNPDLPNRDPFAPLSESARSALDGRSLLRMAEVGAAFDPLRLREPLELWHGDRSRDVERFVKALAEFIAAADVRALDRFLVKTTTGGGDAKAVSTLPCTLRQQPRGAREMLAFECGRSIQAADILALSGRIERQGANVSEGTVDRMQLARGLELRNLPLGKTKIARRRGADEMTTVLSDNGMSPRLPDGRRVAGLRLRWTGTDAVFGSDSHQGEVDVAVVDDVAPIEHAVEAVAEDSRTGRDDAFKAEPFRRAAVMKALFSRLGLPSREWCCVDVKGMAQPDTVETPPGGGASVALLLPFYRGCATCHESREGFPPGFLYGDATRAVRNIDGCAERILYRLAMWNLPDGQRPKTPMPPASAPQSHGFERSAELGAMRAYLKQRIATTTGSPVREAAVVARRYEELPRCAPLFD